jgi:hypothetical protein
MIVLIYIFCYFEIINILILIYMKEVCKSENEGMNYCNKI